MYVYALFLLLVVQIRTHFARPNWRKVFTDLANYHKNSRIGKSHLTKLNRCPLFRGTLIRNSMNLQVFSTVDLQHLRRP